MQTLISCVGDTDPIRNYHDGPLLHIARVYRPEKIVLIHSEHSLAKHDAVYQALTSIPEYDPIIKVDPTVIKDNEVFLFDRMFEVLSNIVQNYYQSEEDILLNLTSATPQIISAMFSINRISGMNVRAFQVVTPVRSSNEGIRHDNAEDIEALINTNTDNQTDFANRIVEDRGEKFTQQLIIQTMTTLLNQYDYEGVFELSVRYKVTSKKKRSKINKRLTNLLDFMKYQKFLSDVKETPFNEKQKLLLNACLLIDLQGRRGLTSEVLIRAKNIAEFVSEYYLMEKYPTLIVWRNEKPYLNAGDFPELVDFLKKDAKKAKREYDSAGYLSLPIYVNMIRFLEPDSKVQHSLNKIQGVNHLRNQVAHGFKEINKKAFKIKDLVTACWDLAEETIGVNSKWLTYFETINKEMENLLKS